MTRLSQIIAVETAVAEDAKRVIAHAQRELASEERLGGLSKTYKPREEDGEQFPGKSTKVQVKAEEVLAGAATALERLFDVRLTKDAANASATVDLRVGSRTLLPKVPVTYMLFLERQLADLAALVAALPLLDPAEEWHPDEVSGCWRSDPAVTDKTKKVPRTLVAYEATPQHPAQVQIWQEDTLAGLWTTVKFSGAVPADRVSAIQERIRELRNAVKYAREEGNATEITDRHAGKAVLGYIFGGRLPSSAA